MFFEIKNPVFASEMDRFSLKFSDADYAFLSF